MNHKKATIICYGPIKEDYNAYFKRVRAIVSQLKELGYIIYVLEFSEKKYPPLECEYNINYIRLKGNEKKFKFLYSILNFDLLKFFRFNIYAFIELYTNREYIKNVDLIIVEGPITIPIILCRLFKKKIILDLHEVSLLKSNNINNRIRRLLFKIGWHILEGLSVRLSDKVITITSSERFAIHKLYKKPLDHIHIIPLVYNKLSTNNINSNNYTIRNMLGILKHKIVVTYVGDLNSLHNFQAAKFIIDSISPYFMKYDDVIFLIVGRGNELFSNKPNNVVFTGYVDNLSLIYEVTDICIAPITMSSGLVMKILEYISYKKIIVATKESIKGLDTNNLDGLFICNIDNFTATLEKVIESYKNKNLNVNYTNIFSININIWNEIIS